MTSMPLRPHFPTKAPGAECGRFPVVLDETDVVRQWVEPKHAQAADILIEDVERRGFDDDLELVVVLQAERVFAVAAIGGAA